MKKKKNLLIVDDHPIVLTGLQALIKQDGNYDNIFAANDIETALQLLKKESIHIAIIDLELNDINGIQLIQAIHKMYIGIKIVVYTMHEELWTIRQLMKEDADAIVMKGDNPKEMLLALHKIEEGKGYFSQQFVRLINTQDSSEASLSKREAEVLEHITNGFSTNDIAQKLNISNNTVEFHRHNLMKKLHVGNVAEMVKKALKLGLDMIHAKNK
jgi:DNA-binding NarL/FixJ family response regulator|uniref:response regulator n=1 Tax=Segatella hominis TaxID=2518605 RepID=UPI0040386858